jgi:HEAT repeat protein
MLSRTKLVGMGLLVLLTALGIAAWVERKPLQAAYYLHELARASDGDRAAVAQRVASLDGDAVPGLIDTLESSDARSGKNVEAALEALARRWPTDDPRAENLAARLAGSFERQSPAGQQTALRFETAWLRGDFGAPPGTGVTSRVAQQLVLAGRAEDAGVRGLALEAASAVLARRDDGATVGLCRELAQTGLDDTLAENRARAVFLAAHPKLELRPQLLPTLRDPAPEVRRAAVTVLGSLPEVLPTQEMLRWLHDPDPDVRRLCEGALREQHLSDEAILMGRLLTDPEFSKRLEVLDRLTHTTEVDAGVWLRYLSHDPADSVRVAAVRSAAETRYHTPVDLADRMEQMLLHDPSPSVRQEAGLYLAQTRGQEVNPGKR